jgi:hypothetical protein
MPQGEPMKVFAGTMLTARGESPAFVACPSREYAKSRGLKNPTQHKHEARMFAGEGVGSGEGLRGHD